MSERDTHFQGFAKLLLKELMGDHSDLTLYTWDEDGIARCEQLIAQRAYDLKEHIMLYAPAAPVPDMIEWPEPE